MKVIPTNLDDCVIIEPDVFYDDRGFFLETFQMERLKEMAGIKHLFVQDNHSRSTKGVLRGLHFQQSNPQGKLVRVARGSVLDIADDLRPQSNTFGQVAEVDLSDSNFQQLWVPPGFAHGFLVLSEVADFQYKCTVYYYRDDEQSIHWQDPDIGVSWPIDIEIIISARDAKAQSFQEYCAKNL